MNTLETHSHRHKNGALRWCYWDNNYYHLCWSVSFLCYVLPTQWSNRYFSFNFLVFYTIFFKKHTTSVSLDYIFFLCSVIESASIQQQRKWNLIGIFFSFFYKSINKIAWNCFLFYYFNTESLHLYFVAACIGAWLGTWVN